MKKIEAIIRKTKFDEVKESLHAAGIDFFTYWEVRGIGKSRESLVYRGVAYETSTIERLTAIIGVISGFVLVGGVNLVDKVFKVDDPVGAISVHGFSGAFGTIMVGLLATEGGLFYGGGTAQLVSQLTGVISVAAWALGTGFILFTIMKHTLGIRVSLRHRNNISSNIKKHEANLCFVFF